MSLSKRIPTRSGTSAASNNTAEVSAVVKSVEMAKHVTGRQTWTDSIVAKSVSDKGTLPSIRQAMREIHAAERYRTESHREGLNNKSRTGQPPLDEHVQYEQEQASLRQERLKELCKKGSNKKSVLSDQTISPVSHLPAHQDKKNIEGDPDLMGREGNIAADLNANTARSFSCPPDTFMPVGSARFVATVCGRMITGKIGNFI